MPPKYNRNCNFCGKEYFGFGKKFCSPKCQYKSAKTDKRFNYWQGKHRSKITKLKISKNNARYWLNRKAFYTGDIHWNWKGGKTNERVKIMQSLAYKLWRKTIFKRDNYTCVWCGKKDRTIQADHIKSFSLYPKLRFSLSNGRTLCRECHKKTLTYLNRWYVHKRKTTRTIISEGNPETSIQN